MNQLMLDQASAQFINDWASANQWYVVSASAPDSEFKRDYAVRVGGLVVDDPRGGYAGNVLVVRPLVG